MSHGMSATLLPSQGDKGLGLGTSHMYIKTESGEIIEFHDRHHPERGKISSDNYSELYEKLYGSVGVKPVDGVLSWQLFAIRMNRDGEMCIATFETVKQANLALKSFCSARRFLSGWDAIEYKEPKINKPKRRGTQTLAKFLAKPVMEFELSVRASNCLETANIKTIREIVTKEEKDMLEYKNFGRTSLNEIKEQLANMGLSLGMNLDDMDWDPDIAEEYTGPDVLSH